MAKGIKEYLLECSIAQIPRRRTSRRIVELGLKLGYAEQTSDAKAVATAKKYNAASTAQAPVSIEICH